MKSLTVLIFICVATVTNAGIGFISDAKAQDCSSGKCVDVCMYESLKMLPGTEVNNDGKCRRVRCSQMFSVQITQ